MVARLDTIQSLDRNFNLQDIKNNSIRLDRGEMRNAENAEDDQNVDQECNKIKRLRHSLVDCVLWSSVWEYM